MGSTDNQRRLNLADIWDVGLLLLGGYRVAVSVNLFLAPARIPEGTMLSLGMIAQHLFGLWAECFAILRRIRPSKPRRRISAAELKHLRRGCQRCIRGAQFCGLHSQAVRCNRQGCRAKYLTCSWQAS